MKIIGHRGAAGLALENTLESFKVAQKFHPYAIELDVRKTSDDQLVVCHDSDTGRIASKNVRINLTTYKALQLVTLKDGKSTVPKLSDALKAIPNTTVIIEIKDEGCMPLLAKVLEGQSSDKFIIASFKTPELAIIKELQGNIKTYGLSHIRPIKLLTTARRLQLDGIGISVWALNPLSYWLARHRGIEMYVYTVNSQLLARIIARIYPSVSICTDRPDKLRAKTT